MTPFGSAWKNSIEIYRTGFPDERRTRVTEKLAAVISSLKAKAWLLT